MRGLELSERFYREFVFPSIVKRMPGLKGKFAAGLIGYGSDVLGYDDEISRDHEWGPRCHIWLSQRDYQRYAPQLNQILTEEIPSVYEGFSTRFSYNPDIGALVANPQGEMHHVAITTVRRHLRIQFGLRRFPLDHLDWLCMPEQKLLEFTRGKIFDDPVGDISHYRQELSYLPDAIWRYKLLYAWESVDNIDIILLNAVRGDMLSAVINLNQLIANIIRLVFLYNRRYCPGTPKWISREFYSLPRLAAEIGPGLVECQRLADIRDCKPILEKTLLDLLAEHNRCMITPEITATPAVFRQEQQSFNLHSLIQALKASLPEELREMEINGSLDQWVTNSDVLIWAEQYRKFRHLYRLKSSVRRDNIGDKMI